MTYALLILAACGLAAILIDSKHGPGEAIRLRVLWPLLSTWIGHVTASNLIGNSTVRGCLVCFSAYTGALVGVVYAALTGDCVPLGTLWLACPMVFWLAFKIVGRGAL